MDVILAKSLNELHDLRNQELWWHRGPPKEYSCIIASADLAIGRLECKDPFGFRFSGSLAGNEWQLQCRWRFIGTVDKLHFATQDRPIATLKRTENRRTVLIDGVSRYTWERTDHARGAWKDHQGQSVVSLTGHKNVRTPSGLEKSGTIRIFEAASAFDAPILTLLGLKVVHYDHAFRNDRSAWDYLFSSLFRGS